MKNLSRSSSADPNELACSGNNILVEESSTGKESKCIVYKVMYDPTYMTQLKTKEFVRRFNGVCGYKYKQFDYPESPKDPRVQYRRPEMPKDLKVPILKVDDDYIGIPPKREVSLFNLNDNVNEKFLLYLTNNQKMSPDEVIVFYHPRSGKHLTMALILFKNSKTARLFVEANNGEKFFGHGMTCIVDPFAAELNGMYTAMVDEPLPTLKYLSGMSEEKLALRREKITETAMEKFLEVTKDSMSQIVRNCYKRKPYALWMLMKKMEKIGREAEKERSSSGYRKRLFFTP